MDGMKSTGCRVGWRGDYCGSPCGWVFAPLRISPPQNAPSRPSSRGFLGREEPETALPGSGGRGRLSIREEAPALCFGPAHAVAADRVAGCPIPGKLSGTLRQSMRARRPRSRVGLLPSLLLLEGTRCQRASKMAGFWAPKVAGSGRSRAHAADLSRLVALRRPSCPFVDRSCSSRGHAPACRAAAVIPGPEGPPGCAP